MYNKNRLYVVIFLLLMICLLQTLNIKGNDNPVRRYQRNTRGHRRVSDGNSSRHQRSQDISNNRLHGIGTDDSPDPNEYEYESNKNMYAYTPPNHEPQYDGYRDEASFHDDTTFNHGNINILDEYTSTISSKILIAFSSACFTTILTSFLCMMLTSKLTPVVVLPFTVLFFLSSFRKSSDLGKLSIAFGIINILLMRRAKPTKTMTEFFFYLRGAFNLTNRMPYPPSENPWSHRFNPDDPNSIQFNMYSTLLATMLLGSTIGSNVAKPIPLFPTWIGALGVAGFCGYTSTLRDGRGDLLRFMGNSIVNCWGTFAEVSAEVDLWNKLNKVTGKSMGHLSRLDGKYKIMDKLKFGITMLVGKVTSMSNQMRNDMQGKNDNTQYSRNGNRERY